MDTNIKNSQIRNIQKLFLGTFFCFKLILKLLLFGFIQFSVRADSQLEFMNVNLLKNDNFEFGMKGWHYQGGKEPGKYEILKSKQCLYLHSEGSGYHGGVFQSLKLRGSRRYKLSAWIKAEIKRGKVTCLYYDGYLPSSKAGVDKKIWWGGRASSSIESFDWRYVEKIIDTPEHIENFTVSVYPVLFLGNDKVWVKNVQLVDLGPAKPRSESCVKFNSNEWKMTAHVNGEVAILPKEVRWKKANDEFKYHGSLALKLNYVFPSTKHDANMFTSDVEIADGAKVVFPVYGDASGHELFLVLFDKSNEAHFLSLGAVDWNGWKMIDASIKELLKGPSSRYDVSCRHWGGDGNQRLDLPITKITIGINDKPDSFSGKGEIGFAWIKFYK